MLLLFFEAVSHKSKKTSPEAVNQTGAVDHHHNLCVLWFYLIRELLVFFPDADQQAVRKAMGVMAPARTVPDRLADSLQNHLSELFLLLAL
jgi:hypothetical protein